MPTRPKIGMARYHHIINRDINKMNVFLDNKDKNIFMLFYLKILE